MRQSACSCCVMASRTTMAIRGLSIGVLSQATNYPFEITYGTGAVAGSVGFETMILGSGSHEIQIPRQGFGMVYDSSMDFLTASCDGLFVSLLPPIPCNVPLHPIKMPCAGMTRLQWTRSATI